MLQKLSAAMGDTFDPAAMAAASTGAEEAEQEDETEELDVHGAASAGRHAACLHSKHTRVLLSLHAVCCTAKIKEVLHRQLHEHMILANCFSVSQMAGHIMLHKQQCLLIWCRGC